MWRMEEIGRAIRKEGPVQLIRHQDQHIRSWLHFRPPQSPSSSTTASLAGLPSNVVTPASQGSKAEGFSLSQALAASSASAPARISPISTFSISTENVSCLKKVAAFGQVSAQPVRDSVKTSAPPKFAPKYSSPPERSEEHTSELQ